MWDGACFLGWDVFHRMGRGVMEWDVFMKSDVFHGMGFDGVGIGCIYARAMRVGVRRPQEEHLQVVAGEDL